MAIDFPNSKHLFPACMQQFNTYIFISHWAALIKYIQKTYFSPPLKKKYVLIFPKDIALKTYVHGFRIPLYHYIYFAESP